MSASGWTCPYVSIHVRAVLAGTDGAATDRTERALPAAGGTGSARRYTLSLIIIIIIAVIITTSTVRHYTDTTTTTRSGQTRRTRPRVPVPHQSAQHALQLVDAGRGRDATVTTRIMIAVGDAAVGSATPGSGTRPRHRAAAATVAAAIPTAMAIVLAARSTTACAPAGIVVIVVQLAKVRGHRTL